MEKMLKFLEDVGAAAGIGAFLLIASWGLLAIDLVDFKPANLASLPAVQLIACLAGTLGLLLLLYRLKAAAQAQAKQADTESNDRSHWERFGSFIRDRRAVMALNDYEHLPSMLASIDSIRDYLRDELQSLPGDTHVRADLERLQEACRDFTSACDRIWKDRQTMPSHLIEALPFEQLQFCTIVGALRGQIAALLKVSAAPNVTAIIAKLVGRA